MQSHVGVPKLSERFKTYRAYGEASVAELAAPFSVSQPAISRSMERFLVMMPSGERNSSMKEGVVFLYSW